MSGGLDSAVACILLQNQGFEVLGITLRIFDPDDKPLGYSPMTVGGNQDITDASEVARQLAIPHVVEDVRIPFANTVIKNFVSEYFSGHTPNPCILCNKTIKWKYILQKADALGCGFIATGHYAQVVRENNRAFVRKALDAQKEQSYMLWQLGQEELKRTFFPLGTLHKMEVRKIAESYNLTRIAEKRESYDICFVPDKDYRLYLKRKKPERIDSFRNGNFIDRNGTFLGHHNGFMFFTIGQRKGLPALGFRAYVSEIRPETNEVVIGKEEDLWFTKIEVKNINTMKYSAIPENIPLTVKLRYRHMGDDALFSSFGENQGILTFSTPVYAPAPGQSVVFYEGDDVLGGGIIDHPNPKDKPNG